MDRERALEWVLMTALESEHMMALQLERLMVLQLEHLMALQWVPKLVRLYMQKNRVQHNRQHYTPYKLWPQLTNIRLQDMQNRWSS